MEKVQSKDGTLIAYERSGDGSPLVLVHGILASHRRWANVIPNLEKDYTIYAIDRRGSGESGDTSSYTLEREFEDIAAIVDSIGTKVNLMGHSHGALCVLGAALLTSNIRRIVAYEPPPGPKIPDLIERVQALVDADDREEAVRVCLCEGLGMPADAFERHKASPIFPARLVSVDAVPREYYAAQAYQADAERYKQMNVPTMLLQGSDSPAFAAENCEFWRGILPNSRIVVLPGQGHLAFDTAPDLFVHEVRTFLTG